MGRKKLSMKELVKRCRSQGKSIYGQRGPNKGKKLTREQLVRKCRPKSKSRKSTSTKSKSRKSKSRKSTRKFGFDPKYMKRRAAAEMKLIAAKHMGIPLFDMEGNPVEDMPTDILMSIVEGVFTPDGVRVYFDENNEFWQSSTDPKFWDVQDQRRRAAAEMPLISAKHLGIRLYDVNGARIEDWWPLDALKSIKDGVFDGELHHVYHEPVDEEMCGSRCAFWSDL